MQVRHTLIALSAIATVSIFLMVGGCETTRGAGEDIGNAARGTGEYVGEVARGERNPVKDTIGVGSRVVDESGKAIGIVANASGEVLNDAGQVVGKVVKGTGRVVNNAGKTIGHVVKGN